MLPVERGPNGINQPMHAQPPIEDQATTLKIKNVLNRIDFKADQRTFKRGIFLFRHNQIVQISGPQPYGSPFTYRCHPREIVPGILKIYVVLK